MRLAGLLRKHRPRREALAFLRYIGPGLLVTVGFIDPGNWASNIAAGAAHGYALLWMVTLSTLMLIVLQHNAAHLGIATGLCLSEAATRHMRPAASRLVLASAMLAAVSTGLAEVLGAALGLSLLVPGLPYRAAAVLVLGVVGVLLFSNSYPRLEKWIVAFVSLIGLSFLFELALVRVPWGRAAAGWVVPSLPHGSLPLIMAVLGAVVMPHNIFLHSEVIQSRRWHLEDEPVIRRQLKYEFADTLFSMTVGWAINSAMIIMAAATFFGGAPVTEVGQAQRMLGPLLGPAAAVVFAAALLLAGLSSSITAGMAGGSIFAGLFGEPYDVKDLHSRLGAAGTLVAATVIVFLIGDPFRGLVVSQMLLSMQLPVTIVTQIRLTSSPKVMGKYANGPALRVLLWTVAAVVIGLNVALLKVLIFG
ncbi:MAG: Mg2+/Co2+ transporter [Candidatus Aminicenantes bacterium]|nr:Mg2+/Co2+ transporter [Candidatus Aminicenantes bacterium]